MFPPGSLAPAPAAAESRLRKEFERHLPAPLPAGLGNSTPQKNQLAISATRIEAINFANFVSMPDADTVSALRILTQFAKLIATARLNN